ncbi:MAG TPA: dihydrofolate reductase family protein, partial [Puia sp.]|nr:dihydrofolate reductase family protein [Puia sp.]
EEKPGLRKPPQAIVRKPFIGNAKAKSFAIAVDAGGKLGWKQNEISGDHIIEILTEKVSDTYLYYLQQRKISYIFAGKSDIHFGSALKQLAKLFPIKTITLEGGGSLNGSMLKARLIDEISLLILPIADATAETPTVFEWVNHKKKEKSSSHLQLTEIKKLKHQVLWLKYRVTKKA